MKPRIFKDYRGYFITFKYYGYNFLSVEDAEKIRCARYNAGVQGTPEEERITMFFWMIGGPGSIVNVEATLKKKVMIYYNHEDIEWYPESKSDRDD